MNGTSPLVAWRRAHQRQKITVTPRIDSASSGHITGPPLSK
jgi:hypothetical protein